MEGGWDVGGQGGSPIRSNLQAVRPGKSLLFNIQYIIISPYIYMVI